MKNYIYLKHVKHLNKHEISCEAVYNKMVLGAIPKKIKKLKKSIESLNFYKNFICENSSNALKR